MNVISYIENNYLGGKPLTKDTKMLLNAIVNSYGENEVLFFLLDDDRERYLRTREYKNQKHFEATLLSLIRKNASYFISDYKSSKKEYKYERVGEPPKFSSADQKRCKKEKNWVF
jgi:hypothetical protein